MRIVVVLPPPCVSCAGAPGIIAEISQMTPASHRSTCRAMALPGQAGGGGPGLRCSNGLLKEVRLPVALQIRPFLKHQMTFECFECVRPEGAATPSRPFIGDTAVVPQDPPAGAATFTIPVSFSALWSSLPKIKSQLRSGRLDPLQRNWHHRQPPFLAHRSAVFRTRPDRLRSCHRDLC